MDCTVCTELASSLQGKIATHLAETHLVCKNTVDPLFVQSGEPVQTLELVLLQGRHEHGRLLYGQFAGQRCGILEVELIGIH